MKGRGVACTINFQALPEECIAHILSYTTPVDACRLSLISNIFCAAAESDIVWNHFLPSDLTSIISRSRSKSSLLATYSSKKALFLALSDHPIIIDNGKKSFQLERRSGKKCYMLAARDLTITWTDTPYPQPLAMIRIPLPVYRFQEAADLFATRRCGFEIRGKINTLALSLDTQYAAYFVFKMRHVVDSIYHYPAELSVGIVGGRCSTKTVSLDAYIEENCGDVRFLELEHPYVRSDGWWEIEMGEFFNSGLEHDEVQMSVIHTKSIVRAFHFQVEGIEVRPKVKVSGAEKREDMIGRVSRNWADKLKNTSTRTYSRICFGICYSLVCLHLLYFRLSLVSFFIMYLSVIICTSLLLIKILFQDSLA